MKDKLVKFCIWPKMAQSISQKVRRFYQCQALRPNPYRKMVPVIPQKSQFPLQFVQADLLKFYPPSHGYDQILVIEDRFTKYVSLYLVGNQH